MPSEGGVLTAEGGMTPEGGVVYSEGGIMPTIFGQRDSEGRQYAFGGRRVNRRGRHDTF